MKTIITIFSLTIGILGLTAPTMAETVEVPFNPYNPAMTHFLMAGAEATIAVDECKKCYCPSLMGMGPWRKHCHEPYSRKIPCGSVDKCPCAEDSDE